MLDKGQRFIAKIGLFLLLCPCNPLILLPDCNVLKVRGQSTYQGYNDCSLKCSRADMAKNVLFYIYTIKFQNPRFYPKHIITDG